MASGRGVLIAKLMLEPADLLLLDEPTNDLDIATLEILEESLLEYTGALILVTHDRYMLDRVSTIVLGLDGRGGAETFAGLRAVGAMARREGGGGDCTGAGWDCGCSGGAGFEWQLFGWEEEVSYLEAREFAGD